MPLPSERLVPSSRHIPGYTCAVSGVGMFGDGGMNASSVSAQRIFRVQPREGTTARSHPKRSSAFSIRASSPSVIPWRFGSGYSPTKLRNPGSTRLPSTRSPPSGFGRSSTTNRTPAFAQASIARAMV